MKEEMIRYFEDEYTRLVNLLERRPAWITVNEAIQNTCQRCLGVAEFSQRLGVSYEDADAHYTVLREKCYELYNRG